MQYHKVISELRTNKNIRVSDLLCDNMSRSSYNRYISGKTDIYSQHFLGLLEQLHISFSELDFIAHGYSNSKKDAFFLNVTLAADARDKEALVLLYHQASSLTKHTRNDFYTHMIDALEIIISYLEAKPYSVNKTSLYCYLLQAFTWTDYEFKFFQFILPFLSPTEVEPFLNKVERNFAKINNSNLYVAEQFRLLCDIVFYFFQHKNYINALHYINLLENFELAENLVYEKLLFIFFTNIKKLLLNQPSSVWKKPIDDCIATAQFLEMSNLSQKFEKTLTELKNSRK
ncbi:Rgg/GadR/MutR family transcriptional regulator [Ligilactobacillus apodemi]|nr:Rgg/GadR/MutR family transcriptional regulator [Ligilactobacillus apodemi]MCR1901665.1 hypothetical protein [Ligilactobacillus apodemi]